MIIRSDFVSNSSSSSYVIPNSSQCKKFVRSISKSMYVFMYDNYSRDNPSVCITFDNGDKKFVESIYKKIYKILWENDIIHGIENLDDDAEFSESHMDCNCDTYVRQSYENDNEWYIAYVPIQYLYAFSVDQQLINFIKKITIDCGDSTFNDSIIGQLLLLFYVLDIDYEAFDHGCQIDKYMINHTNDFLNVIYETLRQSKDNLR